MYRKSFFLIVLALLLTGVLSAGSRMIGSIPGISGNPSSYDPKISLEDAAMKSSNPLLIEFYTDACQTCRQVTPWVHKLGEKYKDRLTFVMVNLDDPKNEQIGAIFKVEYVPALFVFDFKHMSKAQIQPSSYVSPGSLDRGINKALKQVQKDAARKQKQPA